MALLRELFLPLQKAEPTSIEARRLALIDRKDILEASHRSAFVLSSTLTSIFGSGPALLGNGRGILGFSIHESVVCTALGS
jgi:hypothetical protein